MTWGRRRLAAVAAALALLVGRLRAGAARRTVPGGQLPDARIRQPA